MGKRYNPMASGIKRSTKSRIDVTVPVLGSGINQSLKKSKITFRTRDNGMKSRPMVRFDGLERIGHYTSRVIKLTIDSNGMGESDDPAEYVNRLEAKPEYAFFDDIMKDFSERLDGVVDDTADMLSAMVADAIMSDREFDPKSAHDRMDKRAIESGVELLYSAKDHIAYKRNPQVHQSWKYHKDGTPRAKGGVAFLGSVRNLVEEGDLYNALTVIVTRGDGKMVEVIK